MYKRYGPRTRGYRRREERSGMSRRERENEYHKANIQNLVVNKNSFFGNIGNYPFVLRSTAIYTGKMRILDESFFTDTGLELQYYPYGFMQYILKPSDTELFRSQKIIAWDRFRISKIELEYIPTGTESLVSQVIVQNNNPTAVVNNPPYTNLPMMFSYDPTANVINQQEAMDGIERFNTTQTEDRIKLASVARSVMGNNQIKPGSSTKKFEGNVYKPRSQTFSENGPVSTVTNAVVDVRTQYNPAIDSFGRNGKLTSTYGSFNIVIPRFNSTSTIPINLDINVVATFVFKLYGQN